MSQSFVIFKFDWLKRSSFKITLNHGSLILINKLKGAFSEPNIKLFMDFDYLGALVMANGMLYALMLPDDILWVL